MRVLLVLCATASFVLGGFLRPVGWVDVARQYQLLCGQIIAVLFCAAQFSRCSDYEQASIASIVVAALIAGE